MKNYRAKILVKLKPNIKDVKSATLKQAIECLMPVENLKCECGSFYVLNFSSENQCSALNFVEKIASELLSNEVIEVYEVRSLDEVYEEN